MRATDSGVRNEPNEEQQARAVCKKTPVKEGHSRLDAPGHHGLVCQQVVVQVRLSPVANVFAVVVVKVVVVTVLVLIVTWWRCWSADRGRSSGRHIRGRHGGGVGGHRD